MLDPRVLAAFSDEMQKIAFMTPGQSALLGTGLASGTILGAKGKDILQDAREGKVMRRSREEEQKAMLKSFKNPGGEHQ